MDFTKQDLRSSSEVAQPLTLRHQHSGEEITDAEGLPCIVWVKGSNSRSIQLDLMREAKLNLQEMNRKAKSGAKKHEDERTRALEDIQKALISSASRVIDRFENIERGTEALTTSEEDLNWFLDLNFFSVNSLSADAPSIEDKWMGQSFAQQIISFSNEVTHFLMKDSNS